MEFLILVVFISVKILNTLYYILNYLKKKNRISIYNLKLLLL